VTDLVGDFDKDINDRKEWMQTYIDGLKLLGLKYEERTEPWQGACGVFHPMLTESVVQLPVRSHDGDIPSDGACEDADRWCDRQAAVKKQPLRVQRGYELSVD
jgi:hypothetical protein